MHVDLLACKRFHSRILCIHMTINMTYTCIWCPSLLRRVIVLFVILIYLSLSASLAVCLSASVCRRLSSVAILVARSWVSDANHFGWADKAPLVVVGESQVLGQMKSYLTQKSPINVGHVPSSVVVFGEELRMISFLSSSSSALSLSLSGFLPSASAVNAILFVESFSCSCIRATYSPGDTPERL